MPPPLLVFADDWGRHPSSAQHLVRPMLGRRDVVWVNTVGTRPPRLDLATARRVAGKLREWGAPKPPPAANGPAPRVVAPKMWPSFGSAVARRLNRALLLRALAPVVAAMPEPPVILSTIPLVADLVGRLPARKWVYYCVDDFGVWPGYDGATLRAMEAAFVPKADAAIAVSETLQRHLAALGKPGAPLLTHGVDLDLWRRTGDVPAELAAFEPPFVLFWGLIDRRLDLDWLRRLGETLTAGTVALVGPRDAPDPALLSLPRVRLLPAQPLERLPALAAAAGVLVMPYADLPATRAMQPLKLKEYLATGRPAVVRRLPATEAWADACDAVGTADDFAEAVLRRLATGTPAEQLAARSRLAGEGWLAKSAWLEAFLDAPTATAGRPA